MRTILIASFLALGPLTAAQAPIPAPGNRAGAFVASTPGYRFHSDFWVNLHQYLYGIGGGGPEERAGFEAENEACVDRLDAETRQSWQAALTYYRADLGALPHRRGTLRALRYRLTTLGRFASDDPTVGEALVHLEAAAPAYRACLWDAHDARNRARIGEWVDLLVRYARPLQDRLSEVYRDAWPRDLVVDVVSYADFAGANTETGPGLVDHLMIAATDAPAGFADLETLLHEPGHIVLGPFHGAVADALRTAAEEGGGRPPRGLWHAILFHTAGEFVREVAAREGEDHTPHWIEGGLFADYRHAVEAHWQPYLDGEAELEAAARALLRSLADD